MDQKQADEIRQNVRESYSQVAESSNSGESCGTESSCCGVSDDAAINTLVSTRLGYSQDDLDNVPSGADMGLGCGNPRAIASIQSGETVLDLGSGGGFDCFLAAAETGASGSVIGIDMTPTMISKARDNAVKGKYNQVEFRLGEIEYMPVANDMVDVIISNCVINLSPNKQQVFSEAFRVLKPASLISDLQNILEKSGFEKIDISPKDDSKDFIKDWAPGRGVEDYVLSASIEAVKPGGVCCDDSCC